MASLKHPLVLAQVESNPSILEGASPFRVSSICWWIVIVAAQRLDACVLVIQSRHRNSIIKNYLWLVSIFSIENRDFRISTDTGSIWRLVPSYGWLSHFSRFNPDFMIFLAIQLILNSKQLAPRQSWERTEHSGPSRGMGSYLLWCSCFGFWIPGPRIPWSFGPLVPSILWWLWCLKTILHKSQ